MSVRIRIAVALVAIGAALALSCLIETSALSMTLFFSVSLPFFGMAMVLYLVEVLQDLRQHRVL